MIGTVLSFHDIAVNKTKQKFLTSGSLAPSGESGKAINKTQK